MNECVILRGIGGFETSYRHAVLDKKKKIIIPPGKIIHFKPELVKDNGVLEEHMIKTLGISKEEASDSIDACVQEFHDTIRSEGKIFLEGIGHFRLDSNNNISFQEITNENYLADSFGLDVLEIETEEVVTANRVREELKTPASRERKNTGWYIVIGLLLVLIAGTTIVLLLSRGDSQMFRGILGKKKTAEQGVIVIAPQNKPSDTLSESIGEVLDEVTQPKKALAPERVVSQNIPAYGKSYFLIAGSFKYQKNADRLSEILQKKGFEPTIMQSDHFIRVAIGTFDNKQLALAELMRIRTHYDQSVWLLEETK